MGSNDSFFPRRRVRIDKAGDESFEEPSDPAIAAALDEYSDPGSCCYSDNEQQESNSINKAWDKLKQTAVERTPLIVESVKSKFESLSAQIIAKEQEKGLAQQLQSAVANAGERFSLWAEEHANVQEREHGPADITELHDLLSSFDAAAICLTRSREAATTVVVTPPISIANAECHRVHALRHFGAFVHQPKETKLAYLTLNSLRIAVSVSQLGEADDSLLHMVSLSLVRAIVSQFAGTSPIEGSRPKRGNRLLSQQPEDTGTFAAELFSKVRLSVREKVKRSKTLKGYNALIKFPILKSGESFNVIPPQQQPVSSPRQQPAGSPDIYPAVSPAKSPAMSPAVSSASSPAMASPMSPVVMRSQEDNLEVIVEPPPPEPLVNNNNLHSYPLCDKPNAARMLNLAFRVANHQIRTAPWKEKFREASTIATNFSRAVAQVADSKIQSRATIAALQNSIMTTSSEPFKRFSSTGTTVEIPKAKSRPVKKEETRFSSEALTSQLSSVFHRVSDIIRQFGGSDAARAGCTAAVAVLDQSTRAIAVSQVGDTRVLLGMKRGGRIMAVSLSADHGVSSQSESSRLISMGCCIVENEPAVFRFPNDMRSTSTRGFGCFELRQYGFSGTADITAADLPPKLDNEAFLLLCPTLVISAFGSIKQIIKYAGQLLWERQFSAKETADMIGNECQVLLVCRGIVANPNLYVSVILLD